MPGSPLIYALYFFSWSIRIRLLIKNNTKEMQQFIFFPMLYIEKISLLFQSTCVTITTLQLCLEKNNSIL